jgi:hypothetical protein
MRGLRDFQRGQMKNNDPRVIEFFRFLRNAVDMLEQAMGSDVVPMEHEAKTLRLAVGLLEKHSTGCAKSIPRRAMIRAWDDSPFAPSCR